MNTRHNRFGSKLLVGATACALVLIATSAHADETPRGQVSLLTPYAQDRVFNGRGVDVEQTFWLCDYAMSGEGYASTPAVLCSAYYEELKTNAFGGDFDRLLTWWRANRYAEHQKLSNGDR